MTAIEIGGTQIAPGSDVRLQLPIAQLPSGASQSLPVRVRRGKRSGPVLFVSAAIHGDEVNGVEILRRVLRSPALKRLRGTLIAVPVVNVFGFSDQSRYLPDRRDLNRCFPGSESGSLGSRLAHIFMKEVVAHSTHGMDLHTGSNQRMNLPQLRITKDQPGCLELAQAFGVPVVMQSKVREGSLRASIAAAEIPLLVYEAGEANRFDEWAIRTGVRGVLRVMRTLEMLPARKVRSKIPAPLLVSSSSWVRASESGIFRPSTALGASVTKGDPLGWTADTLGDHEAAVLAAFDGVVIGRTNQPLVYEGDALYHVARTEEDEVPEVPLEDFRVDLRQPFLMDEEDTE